MRLMSFAHTGFQGFGASLNFAKIPEALEHSTLADFEEHPFVLSFGVRKVRSTVDRLAETISLHDSEGQKMIIQKISVLYDQKQHFQCKIHF